MNSLSLNRNQLIGLEQQVLNIHGDLIDRCKAGNRDAYYKLYKLYARAMYNVSFRILNREEDAEDAVQDAFINAFKNLESYRGDATFGAWLKRIVVYKSINLLNKRKHELFREDEEWDVAEETDAAADYRDELSVDKVRHAIARLPDGYRSVLTLYLLEGYDHQEIAEIMKISESTSKSQLNRAKNKLREILSISI